MKSKDLLIAAYILRNYARRHPETNIIMGLRSNPDALFEVAKELEKIAKDAPDTVELIDRNAWSYVSLWGKEDIHGIFENLNVPFSEERYLEVLPDIIDYFEDNSNNMEALEDIVHAKYPSRTEDEIKRLWQRFEDIPVNPKTECIETTWRQFDVGTHRETIWKWFEEYFSIHVSDLIYHFDDFRYLTTGEDLEAYVSQEYQNSDTELNSWFFDISVSMKKSEILKSYAEIQRRINGDFVCYHRDPIFSLNDLPPEYDEIYSGNCKDFLESFNGRESETGFYRFDDYEKLDFIW